MKSEIQMGILKASIPVGFFTYPSARLQILRHLRQQRFLLVRISCLCLNRQSEIVRKFNSVFGDTLVEPEDLAPE